MRKIMLAFLSAVLFIVMGFCTVFSGVYSYKVDVKTHVPKEEQPVEPEIPEEPEVPELVTSDPLSFEEGDHVLENLKVTVLGEGNAVAVSGTAAVTINSGEYDGGQTPFGGAGNTVVWLQEATANIIINDGLFTNKGLAVDENGNLDTGHIDMIYCSAGTIEINGGFFEGEDDTVWLLNCKDSGYRDGIAEIVVKGGTFVNWNPADNVSEGANTNFVAEGYEVELEEQENGDIWYKVREAVVAAVGDVGEDSSLGESWSTETQPQPSTEESEFVEITIKREFGEVITDKLGLTDEIEKFGVEKARFVAQFIALMSMCGFTVSILCLFQKPKEKDKKPKELKPTKELKKSKFRMSDQHLLESVNNDIKVETPQAPVDFPVRSGKGPRVKF